MLNRAESKITNTCIMVSLGNFFIAACLGLFMRYAFVWGSGWIKYKNAMYAHSHVALAGWLYLMLVILLWKAFDQPVTSKFFIALFCLTELSVIGSLFAFTMDGYSFFALGFVLLFVFLTYLLTFYLWKKTSGRSGEDVLLLKTSLVWLIISSLGLWAMIPILMMKSTDYFYMTIQFFLHFQFNGWLLFSVLALFFYQLRQMNVTYSQKGFKVFFCLLIVSTLLTFALAITWVNPDTFVFALNSAGVIIQLCALLAFFKWFSTPAGILLQSQTDRFTRWMFGFAFLSFILKIVIQTAVIFPDIATISYTIRLYVLGFMHLITLGMITAYVLGYSFSAGYVSYKKTLSKTGWVLLLMGIIITEVLLFGQGTLVWMGLGYIRHYHTIIFLASILLPLGILLAGIGQLAKSEINFSPNSTQV